MVLVDVVAEGWEEPGSDQVNDVGLPKACAVKVTGVPGQTLVEEALMAVTSGGAPAERSLTLTLST